MLIDIHTHTFLKSDDGFISPEHLITEAKRVDMDGIRLTDHNGSCDPVSATELSREYDFPIFPGCVVVVPHPYRRPFREEDAASDDEYRSLVDRACQSEVSGLVDGVEVSNGRDSDAGNAFALDVSKRFNLNGTGASDAHKLEDVGTFVTDFLQTIKTIKELIGGLKSGRFQSLVIEERQSLAIGVQ